VRSYRDLIAWQKAMRLMLEIYQTAQRFPKNETYGLAQQLQRCAVSIPSNIAEGSSRRSTQEFLRFLNISTGSLAEAETQISAAQMLGYITAGQETILLQQCDEVSRIIQGLYSSLKDKASRLSTLDSSH
jgi:four helix bundle protein